MHEFDLDQPLARPHPLARRLALKLGAVLRHVLVTLLQRATVLHLASEGSLGVVAAHPRLRPANQLLLWDRAALEGWHPVLAELAHRPDLPRAVAERAVRASIGARDAAATNQALPADLQLVVARSTLRRDRLALALNRSITPDAADALLVRDDEQLEDLLASTGAVAPHAAMRVRFLQRLPAGRELLTTLRALAPEVYDVLAPGFTGTALELEAALRSLATEPAS